MRRLAIRSMLSQRAAEGGIVVTAPDLAFEPRSGAMAKLCRALGVERNALLVSDGLDENLVRGARNLQHISASLAETLNTYLLITHDRLIMTEAAVRRVESLWALPAADAGGLADDPASANDGEGG